MARTCFSSILAYFKYLFRLPIYSEIDCIHSHLQHGRPFSAKLKYFLLRLIILHFSLRMLAVSVCIFLKWDAYFQYDIIYRILFKESGLNDEYYSFFCIGIPLLTHYLYRKLHIHSDPAIWAPLYDLVVRNFNQSYLFLNWRTFPSVLSIEIPRNAPLRIFHRLSRRHRRHVLLIQLLLECTTYSLKVIYAVVMIATCYYIALNRPLLQMLQIILDIVCFAFMCYHLSKSILLLMSCLFILLYVYSMQYIALNCKLHRLVTKVCCNLKRIYRFLGHFRSVHTHLTTYLLYFNKTFTDPVGVQLEMYLLPLHSYTVVMLYFRSHLLFYIEAQLHLFLAITTTVITICMTCLWLTNKMINRSAADLNRLLLCNGRKEANRAYLVEHLKLSTYYELLWRTDKQLGFTHGNGGAYISTKFILDNWLRYTVYVLYFGGNFITAKKNIIL